MSTCHPTRQVPQCRACGEFAPTGQPPVTPPPGLGGRTAPAVRRHPAGDPAVASAARAVPAPTVAVLHPHLRRSVAEGESRRRSTARSPVPPRPSSDGFPHPQDETATRRTTTRG